VSNNNPAAQLPANTKPALHNITVIYRLIRNLVPEVVICNVTVLYKCILITACSLALWHKLALKMCIFFQLMVMAALSKLIQPSQFEKNEKSAVKKKASKYTFA